MKKKSVFNDLESIATAPYGYRKDGQPKRKPGAPNINQYNQQRQAQKDNNSTELQHKTKEAPDKSLNILQKDLHRLGREAIKTLRDGLKDQDVRVRIQAATAATRTSVLGLAKEMWAGDGLASIGIYHSAQDSQSTEQPDSATIEQIETGEPTGHPRTGRPVTIIR